MYYLEVVSERGYNKTYHFPHMLEDEAEVIMKLYSLGTEEIPMVEEIQLLMANEVYVAEIMPIKGHDRSWAYVVHAPSVMAAIARIMEYSNTKMWLNKQCLN